MKQVAEHHSHRLKINLNIYIYWLLVQKCEKQISTQQIKIVIASEEEVGV